MYNRRSKHRGGSIIIRTLSSMFYKKVFIILYILAFIASIYINVTTDEPIFMMDNSRLQKAKVYKIVEVNEERDILNALAEAKAKNKKLSIAGARHSQGGHTFCHDCLVLDMTEFNQILAIDPEQKIITVQSGVTWEQIQQAINPYQLAIRVMQSSNIFTTGGSLSSNVHGRDPREGPIIDSIASFRILLASGEIVEASPIQNKELFELAIGGYGLFGVILDVTLELTSNEVYQEEMRFLSYSEFPAYFLQELKDQPQVGLSVARLSVAPSSFLQEMYIQNYWIVDDTAAEAEEQLQDEKHIEEAKFLFGLSRKYDWGKELSWTLQKKLFLPESNQFLTRNNAMRPGIRFLEYYSSQRTDILQEYFVPIDQFVSFVDGLRELLREDESNLLNVTIRYVPKNEKAFLSYAQDDAFALVFLFNHRLNPRGIAEMEKVTKQIVDLAHAHHATYYLTYQLVPTKEQLRVVYPNINRFFELKRKYDPHEMFYNEFYERYSSYES